MTPTRPPASHTPRDGVLAFRATVDPAGRTATGIRVPAEVVAALGSGKQPLVRVTIGDHVYPSRIAVRGDAYLLPLSAENRTAAGVAAGDEVVVEIALDTKPRELAVPADLARALDAAPDARRHFDGLSHSRRKAFVTGIEGAKKPETRARRVAQAVTALSAGRSTP